MKTRKIFGAVGLLCLGVVLVSTGFYEVTGTGHFTNSVAEFLGNPALFGLTAIGFWALLEMTFGD